MRCAANCHAATSLEHTAGFISTADTRLLYCNVSSAWQRLVRKLAGVDQLLATPDVDGLLTDIQIDRDLREATASGDKVEHLARRVVSAT